MMFRLRHFAILSAMVFIIGGLSGCGSINSSIAPAVTDAIPQWAGGLPPDAPPRPGTAKYDEYMQERERKRFEPAVKEDPAKAPSSSSTPASSSGAVQ